MKYKEVVVIILNWNGLNETRHCLTSLLKNKYPSYKILVLDNGSKQNEALILKKEFENKVEFIRVNKNLGFTGGANVGIEISRKRYNPDYYLLLNNDTEVEPDFLAELVKNSSDPAVGLSSPLILNFYNREKIWFGGGSINWWLAKPYHITTIGKYRGEEKYLTGCSLLIKKEVIDQVGLLDNRFFAYFEDAAYSLKVREKGMICKLVPSAKVYHMQAASTGKISKFNTYLVSRNRILFVRNYLPRYYLPYYFLFFAFKLILADFYFFLHGQHQRVFAYNKGFFDGVRNLGGEPKI